VLFAFAHQLALTVIRAIPGTRSKLNYGASWRPGHKFERACWSRRGAARPSFYEGSSSRNPTFIVT
jgi:hypothetical protein